MFPTDGKAQLIGDYCDFPAVAPGRAFAPTVAARRSFCFTETRFVSVFFFGLDRWSIGSSNRCGLIGF
jgi:hypothetical protein